MKKGEKFKIYREERKNGLTYQQIADKYGVSKQTVGQACRTYNANMYRPVTPKRCIYVNLRNWMNKNKVGTVELTRRLGVEGAGRNEYQMRNLLLGAFQPRKPHIDRLIEITGLTYEQLFQEG
jgi:transcriptional regulator with XRE-family HTH domain